MSSEEGVWKLQDFVEFFNLKAKVFNNIFSHKEIDTPIESFLDIPEYVRISRNLYIRVGFEISSLWREMFRASTFVNIGAPTEEYGSIQISGHPYPILLFLYVSGDLGFINILSCLKSYLGCSKISFPFPIIHRSEMIIMPLELTTFHQKMQVYPETYLLPEEEQALTIILETLENLFGEQISQLPHATRLQLVRDVVHACIHAVRKE